jgi:hypothetical protein
MWNENVVPFQTRQKWAVEAGEPDISIWHLYFCANGRDKSITQKQHCSPAKPLFMAIWCILRRLGWAGQIRLNSVYRIEMLQSALQAVIDTRVAAPWFQPI